MDDYESLGTIGEGTYGVVLKCRHKATGQIVAIKRFKESDDDEQVKKTALREIKVLKQLRHENVVNLLDVFRVKGKLYLVFEFVEKTILEEIEKHPDGLDPGRLKRLMWQLVRAIAFCHQHNVIHRDIKPENLLVSRNGVLKLCDFGFARPLAGAGAKYTEYVSTRWYRAPELLVGDVSYGKAVDVWSIGCMFAEIATGLPLFPGDSDIDQLYHIIRCLGHVTPRQQELFRKNALYAGVKLPQANELEPLEARFPNFDAASLDLLRQTIRDEPLDRWTCAELLNHSFFADSHATFEAELQQAIARDLNDAGALLQRKKRIRKPQRVEVDNNNSGGVSALRQPSPVTLTSLNASMDHDQPLPPQLQYVKASGRGKVNGGVAKKVIPLVPQQQQQQQQQQQPQYHLPTLQNSGSSSCSSTASTASVGSSENSPTTSYPKKITGFGVPPIAENAVSPESMANIHQLTATRQSMTSQAHARFATNNHAPTASYAFSGPPPKPPPTSHARSPYATPKKAAAAGTPHATKDGSSSGLSSPYCAMDVYSPKKMASGHKLPVDTARHNVYVPPRTSHAASRGSRRRVGDLNHF